MSYDDKLMYSSIDDSNTIHKIFMQCFLARNIPTPSSAHNINL